MLDIRQAVVVEGTYDKIRLSSLLNTLIIPTNGFSIFKDQEKIQLLRQLSITPGVIIFTDSDSAGFLIRSRLKQLLSGGTVYHAYIPDVYGKEKRKRKPSAEGKLGVEGMDTAALQYALQQAGVTANTVSAPSTSITKADFMRWGLTGVPGAAENRTKLLQHLQLPARMSSNTLLEVLQRLYGYEEIEQMINKLFKSEYVVI